MLGALLLATLGQFVLVCRVDQDNCCTNHSAEDQAKKGEFADASVPAAFLLEDDSCADELARTYARALVGILTVDSEEHV